MAGEAEVLGESLPQFLLSTTYPTWVDLGSNTDRSGGKPATNRLSYATAFFGGWQLRNFVEYSPSTDMNS
jgi:hypothetical protein